MKKETRTMENQEIRGMAKCTARPLVAAFAAIVLVCAAAQTSMAASSAFAYQGVLQDENGAALSGNKTVEFRLYGSETGGSPLWGRAISVLLDSDGLFNTELSDSAGSALANAPSGAKLATVFATNTDKALYVGMTVAGSSGEIQPRQKLLAVPYATYAADVAQASGDFIVAGCLVAASASVTNQLSAASLQTSGALSVGGNLTVSGTISGFGSVPMGSIIMWNGAEDTVPDGWALCNGQTLNGVKTPDLRNRFIVGAGSSYSVGATGGADKVTLTKNEMPSHSHAVYGRSSGYAGSHNNSHEVITYKSKDWGSMSEFINDTDSTGGGGAHENRPPYYALCFIMRVK